MSNPRRARDGRSGDPPILRGESRDEHPNLGHLVRIPFQAIVQRVSDGLAEAGFDDIRPAHTSVFQHIKADGSRLSELAERAQMTKQSMAYLVDYLEDRGYVERNPDPADRRARLIYLTARGWEEVRTALALIEEVEQDWSRQLGRRHMAHLRSLLEELAGQIDAERPGFGSAETDGVGQAPSRNSATMKLKGS